MADSIDVLMCLMLVKYVTMMVSKYLSLSNLCYSQIIVRPVFPAGALRAPAGPKIVLVPPLSIFIYIYVCPHLKIIMPFIHVVLEECTP